MLAAGAYREVNSQTVLLLQAAPGSRPLASRASEIVISANALVPSSGPSAPASAGFANTVSESHESISGTISTYKVREGDTISGIADAFNVSVNTILWANGISKGMPLKVGQSLVVLPISGVQYKVQKGDTPALIAKKFKGDVDEILQFNNIADDSQLAAGATIIIPHGEAPAIVSALAKSRARASGVSTASSLGASLSQTNSYFMRPVVGGIKTQGLHGWNGVDLASAPGTPILAAATGNIIVAHTSGWNGGYGKYVVISHPNGTQTLYAHLNSVDIGAGESVSQGQVIGTMGKTGESTGVHLHFEVRSGVNPF